MSDVALKIGNSYVSQACNDDMVKRNKIEKPSALLDLIRFSFVFIIIFYIFILY